MLLFWDWLRYAILGLAAGRPAQAQTVLNFDTTFGGDPIANGTLINDAYPTAGVTFSGNAVIFTSGGGVPSQPNFASSTNNFDPVTAIFTGTASNISATDVTNSSFTLTGYDAGGNVLGSSKVSNFLDVATLNFSGIKSISISTTFQYGFDNFTFTPSAVTTTPEPSSLATLGLCGLITTGLMLTARKRKSVA